ncbi:hypothetical protein PVAND_004038 [Polypedilum vanderplanki]|uniref:Uncharacterized protein n=1 Tax=Polypedilum vanderplanki TaxID=319348 RepID=A0A9J6BVU6_POLVA|nr:hypothetical protein PVAND_004038 [Polypedilum vanderplanki]
MLKIIKNFCLNTNLNGFIYIAQPSRHKIERIFWSITIFISFILTGFLIKKLIRESEKNPIVIYTDQNVVHVENINFPAISVCPGIILHTPKRLTFVYKHYVDLIKNKFGVNAYEERIMKMMQVASLMMRDNFMQSYFEMFSIPTDDFVEQLHKFEPFFFTTYDLIRNRTLSFFDATWLRNSMANFTQTFWKQGFCYTFNFPGIDKMFHLEKISKDFVYQTFTPGIDSYNLPALNSSLPLKSPLPGEGLVIRYNKEYIYIVQNTTISVDMKTYDRIYLFDIYQFAAPQTLKNGHRFIFHDSYEVVPFNAKSFYSNSDSITKILITPKIRRVDESLRKEKAEIRNCYMDNERRLKFLKVYNRVNCEHECLAEITLSSCKCVQFFMVRDRKTRICGARDENCYRSIEDNFENLKDDCKCYENCNNIKYERRIAYMKKSDRNIFEFLRKTEAKIIIEMSSHVFLSVSKRQSTTVIDLLSLSGGFLGLFAGFSVLSAAEIVYYFLMIPLIQFRAKKSTRVIPFNEESMKAKENSVIKYFKKILQESSIHGFNHIGNSQKNIFERIIWSLLFLISMICTYLIVMQVYGKTNINSVSITMEGSLTKVEDIPFPAVTFQPNYFDYSKSFDLSRLMRIFVSKDFGTKMFNKISQFRTFTDLRKQVLAMICGGAVAKIIKYDFYNFSKSTAVYDDFRTYINESRQFQWFISKYARWWEQNPLELAEIMTKNGINYVFNMIEASKLLKLKKITKDFNYSYGKEVNYPVKTSAGLSKGASIGFQSLKSAMPCTKASFVIHSPYEFPTANEVVEIDPNLVYRILITPSIIKTDDDLRTLPVSFRKCYFEDERDLKFFKIYTQRNCEFECLSEAINKKCNCVPFYFIRSPKWQVCEYRRMKFCVEKFLFERSIGNATEKFDCDCLPGCNSITYSYEIFTTQAVHEHNVAEFYAIHFGFEDPEHYALIRYQEFKLVDFLSYVGGILGLFAGISVISFVEIAYFITFRLITDLKRHFL